MYESLFRDPARSGVFHLPAQDRNVIEAAAGAARLKIVAVRLEQSGDKVSALRELGRALNFPEWYGDNLDALHDCLTDPDWQPAASPLLLISGLDRLRNADPEGFSALIDVFRAAAEARREAGSSMWVLLDTTTADLPTLPSP